MRRRLLLLLAAGLLAAGCTSTAPGGPDTASGPSPAPPSDAAPSPADEPAPTGPGIPEVLTFAGETVQGDQVDGSALAGGDVALWFWAPW